MKLYAPTYYKNFKCIADKCKHSCCIGWEIDVDSDTLQMYEALDRPYAETVRNSISYDETPHFVLCEQGNCPHLRNDGLCELILQLGENNLCEICREHPRFYHETAHGMEVGIGMSCEEACRIILESDYTAFDELQELTDELEGIPFDVQPLRERAYEILSSALPYPERLRLLADAFDITLAPDEQVRKTLALLEYLDETHRELFAHYTSDAALPANLEIEAERALAYFIFRHCSPAWCEEDFCTALRFCLACERLLASIVQKTGVATIAEVARTLSEEIEYSEDNTDALMQL